MRQNLKYILILLVALGAIIVGADLTKPQDPIAPPSVTEKVEKPLIEQINEVRAKAGKKPLVEDQKLNEIARLKVNDQVARNYWAHHLPGERTAQFGKDYYPGKRLSENIAKCQLTDSQRVREWVNSPSHYKAIVDDFDGFGFAYAVNPKDNNCVYTVTYFIEY